jgi:hypothetical protein
MTNVDETPALTTIRLDRVQIIVRDSTSRT